jgi:hypothetical protein
MMPSLHLVQTKEKEKQSVGSEHLKQAVSKKEIHWYDETYFGHWQSKNLLAFSSAFRREVGS